MDTIEKRGAEFDLGDLARAIEARYGLSYAATRNLFGRFAEILPDILTQHGRLEVPEVGVFTLGPRYEKKDDGFHVVDGSKKIRFEASKALKQAAGVE